MTSSEVLGFSFRKRLVTFCTKSATFDPTSLQKGQKQRYLKLITWKVLNIPFNQPSNKQNNQARTMHRGNIKKYRQKHIYSIIILHVLLYGWTEEVVSILFNTNVFGENQPNLVTAPHFNLCNIYRKKVKLLLAYW